MILAAATLAGASAIHFGATVNVEIAVIRDPFAGAALPEAILAVIVAVGAVWVLAPLPRSRPVGIGTTLFAILVVLFGMSITIRGGRSGDIAYHVTLLLILLVAGFVLARRGSERPIVGS